MEWIGFSKNDPNQEKFVFDDSAVLTTEPPQYSIRFLESGEQTSILCSDVFKLKPVKPMKRKTVTMSDTPEPETTGTSITVPAVPVPTLTDDEEIQREIEESLRPKWNRQKDNAVVPEIPDITLKEPVKKVRKKSGQAAVKLAEEVSVDNGVGYGGQTRHKYEYKTVTEDLDDAGRIESILNEHGENGWELVGFETIHSVLPNRSRLFCVLKRIKE